jgi:hypothetical protein
MHSIEQKLGWRNIVAAWLIVCTFISGSGKAWQPAGDFCLGKNWQQT